jgi:hypothetical protein
MKVWKPMIGATLALALVASGCGGGKKDDSTSAATVATTESGNGSPEAILNSISTNTSATGPQQITLNLKLGVDGDPKDPSVAAFLSKPVTLTVDGATDGTAKKTDLTFSVAAGPLAFNGAVRQMGDQAWLQLNGKWYTLPADALSSSSGGSGTTTTGGTSKIDAQQIIAAFGKPGSIIKDAKLDGTEDVGGVKSDHISGSVDIAALVKGLTTAMSSVGSTSTPISPADLQSSVTQLQQFIKGATVDIFVGQSDHFIHKLATKIDGSIPSDQQAGSGISGFDLSFDVSSVGTDSPNVSAPDNPAPYEQLQSDIGGLLGGGLPSSP